nr:NAD-dependent epimerase/dehydratase family protein [Aurantimonas sp. VKM B-3413]
MTGISGFIGKHVALAMLGAGFLVRGTLRSQGKAEAVRAALAEAGADPARVEFAVADLTRDEGWQEAAEGCRFVAHTASPFPARQPRDRQALVPIAKGGTLRVVRAALAAGAERLVLTSSVASVYYGHPRRTEPRFGEEDWTDVTNGSVTAYAVSKTEAERAAWGAVDGTALQMAAINPALVLGPLLDGEAGTSARLVAMMMNGRLPAVPNASFGIVDVRDVAEAHALALTVPGAAGHRFLLSGGSMTLLEIANVMAAEYPDLARRLPRFVLPDALVRIAALVAPEARALRAELGRRKQLVTDPAQRILGLSFRSPRIAVRDMAESLGKRGLVKEV